MPPPSSRSPANYFMERFSVLQRMGFLGVMALLLLIAAGVYTFFLATPKEKPFYTPGTVQTREDCFYGKLAQFRNVTRQILFAAAQECEIEVQSVEGHEQRRQEWMERQAERERQRALNPQPAPVAEEPREKDTLRRVWR